MTVRFSSARRFLIALGCAVLVSSLAGPGSVAAEAPPEAPSGKRGHIRLSGIGSGYVDVTLRKPVTLDLPGFDSGFDPAAEWFESSQAGTVVGWQIESEGKPIMSAFWLRHLDEEASVPNAVRFVVRPQLMDDQTLKPGRYRFVLIGEGKDAPAPRWVSIPTTGPSIDLRTEKAIDVQVIADELEVLNAAPAALALEDVDLPEGSTVIMGGSITFDAPPTQQVNAHACLIGPMEDRLAGLCPDAVGFFSGAVAERYWMAFHRYYASSVIGPGKYRALWRFNGIGLEPERVRILLVAYKVA